MAFRCLGAQDLVEVLGDDASSQKEAGDDLRKPAASR
jgi:hypothetical protein